MNPLSHKTVIKLIATAAFAFAAINASAHTTSLGNFNAGAPGSVTVAMGTYLHGGGLNTAEGAIQLIAGPAGWVGPSAIVNFGGFTNTKPSGLIDGVNNFYAEGQSGSGPVGSYTDFPAVGQAASNLPVQWQTATFTGLIAGTYTYAISGMQRVTWADWNSGSANWRGQFVIQGSSVSTPDGGSTAALLGASLLGFVALRRRFSRA